MDFFQALERSGGNPLGQLLADFLGSDGSTGFRVANASVDGSERLSVFLVGDGSRTFKIEFLRLRHRLIVGWSRWAAQWNSLPSSRGRLLAKGGQKWGTRPESRSWESRIGRRNRARKRDGRGSCIGAAFGLRLGRKQEIGGGETGWHGLREYLARVR